MKICFHQALLAGIFGVFVIFRNLACRNIDPPQMWLNQSGESLAVTGLRFGNEPQWIYV
jgi:hypothetical protein